MVPKLGTVGTEEMNVANHEKMATIYPNPARDNLTIKFRDPQKNAVIMVVDMIGKMERRYDEIHIKSTNLDVSNLKNGVYFINIRSNNKTMTEKVIINH